MVRKKDPFWEYVEPLNGRFVCNFCGRNFPGGVPRIKSHLAGVTGRDIDICRKVPQDVQARAFLAIGGGNGSNKKARTIEEMTLPPSSTAEERKIASILAVGFQQTSTVPAGISCTKKTDQKDKNEVDKKLAKFFVLNNIDFSVVEKPSFKEFLTSAMEYGPSYEIPSCSTLRTKLIPDSRKEVEEYVSMVKKLWVTEGCTLTSDVWTNDEQAYVNIVAYSPRGAVFLNSFEVSKEQQTTGTYLKDIMASVVDDIGAEHVVQIITNNAKSSSAGEGDNMLMGRYPHLYKTSCVSRGIDLLLKNIYMEIESVRKVIDDAKLIVTFMYMDKTVLSLMREHTNGRELKHPCATRFASNVKMVKSVIDVENELRMLVTESTWKGGGLLDNSSIHAMSFKEVVTNIIQNSEFWRQGKEVLQALDPIVRVLQLVDGERSSTSGYLYEAMERAKEAIKQNCNNNDESKYMHQHIWTLFEGTRRSGNILHPVHAAAALLNPAYMCSENFKEDKEMKEGIEYLLENVVASEEKPTFLKELQLYRMKASSLFTTTAVMMLKTSHPRVWWDYCGDSLPTVRKYAVRILSQPCSSTNWSTSAWEVAQIKKRNGRLAPQMLETLVYVIMNTTMMDKFKVIEARDLEPIDLDKLDELPDYFDIDEQNEDGCRLDSIESHVMVEDWSWLDIGGVNHHIDD